jgi:hypothetical protein
MFGRRLPRPTDPGDEKVLSDIRKYGFHAKHVRRGAHPEHAREEAELGPHPIYDIGFSYTVGLHFSLRHPELVLVSGMPDRQAHDILWQVVRLIRDGATFSDGDESQEILHDVPARFSAVSPRWRKELLTFADWAARRKRFEALQIVMPDRTGTFPTSPAYAGPPQPLLLDT